MSQIFTSLYYVQNHVEGYLELSAKTKTYFATAVNLWDADFYVKVDDDVHVNIGINSSKVSDNLLLYYVSRHEFYCKPPDTVFDS